MGRKSSAKGSTPPQPPVGASRRSPILLVGGLFVLAALAGGAFYLRSGAAADAQAADALDAPARPPIPADLKPHAQANLPPLEFPGYEMPRPAATVSAAYKFAAEHPEVLSYVPCFCGCEHSGHRGNEDCFVKSRDVNGDVVAWEEHGMECAVCIDVATRARQMHAAGASVAEIRAAVDKEWGPRSTTHTPTPAPPHPH